MEALRLHRMDFPIKKKYCNIFEIIYKSETPAKSDFEKITVITVIQILLTNASYSESEWFKLSIDNLINKGKRNIVIDLRKCEHIDSIFWGVVYSAQKKIHLLNGSIRIVFDTRKQSVLFIAFRMDKIFRIYENVSQAVNSFKNKSLGQTMVEGESNFFEE